VDASSHSWDDRSVAKRATRTLDPAAMLVFGALARGGGVRAAARALGMPRSTVSRRLAEMEAEAGAALVVRTSRRFALTALGLALASRCDELDALLRASEAVVRLATSEPSGTLRVTVAPVLGEEILPSVAAELLRRWPKLSIEARLAADFVDLRRGAVDVALRVGALEDATDLFAARVGASVTGCFVSPGYAAERGVPKTPADLARHECVLVGRDRRAWSFASGARRADVAVGGRLVVDSFRVARDAAALGVGVARVPTVFAESLVARGELVPVLERYWTRGDIHAVHAGPVPPPPRVRAFVDAARAAVARALPDTVASSRPPRWRSA